MAADFYNGLSIVPLDSTDDNLWTHDLAAGSAAEHPWAGLYLNRCRIPTTHSSSCPPDTSEPPFSYVSESSLRKSYSSDAHSIIRLCDVQAFRAETAKKAGLVDLNGNDVDAIGGRFSRLGLASSTGPIRPVIYRYVDAVKNRLALLEAIHFELFLPDRPDLRFLAVPSAAVPASTVEGDLFRIRSFDLLPDASFAVALGPRAEYPVVWQIRRMDQMHFDPRPTKDAVAYIFSKKAAAQGGEAAVSESSDRELLIREALFPNKDARRVHSIVRVSLQSLGTAHLHPVEPPFPAPPPPHRSPAPLAAAATAKKGVSCFDSSDEEEEERGKKEREEDEWDGRSEYLKMVHGTCTSSQRSGHIVTAVSPLTEAEEQRIEDRLGEFLEFGQPGDLQLMEDLFRLGSRFRELCSSSGVDTTDAGDMRIDESVILQTIKLKDLGPLESSRWTLQEIYGRTGGRLSSLSEDSSSAAAAAALVGGLRLNPQQARALTLYTDPYGPRVFCILSPPGSGKTTVAAAMAAAAARAPLPEVDFCDLFDENGEYQPIIHPVQLLLAVQNVAVDNIGAALKKMDYGGQQVYNMKTDRKQDAASPAPFDFFDCMDAGLRRDWQEDRIDLHRSVFNHDLLVRRAEYKKLTKLECLNHDRRIYEKGIKPRIILSTVEMVLKKMLTPSGLLKYLKEVKQIIIDEASLLTEAALFAIIRRFPYARIVLIGDDRQLPPFKYDEKVLGHELAGRPALSVAMKTGRVPVVKLTEVYRAPPSLVEPYNRLAYGGELVSRKAEENGLLTGLGLVSSGRPQLLLIDVHSGAQIRNDATKSLFNLEEMDKLIRLLRKFPDSWTEDIMIICLYKEQKTKLEEKLDKRYTVLTVDSAQGKEKAIVILLTTRTIYDDGFFCSKERCNVAISRQQRALIILGKASLLTTIVPWSTVVNRDDFTRVSADSI